MRRYRYFTGDVFTTTRFGGNPLAVITDATGITEREMAAITREFNYAETVFVLPPERGGTRRVRLFTQGGEVPFAGHPNIGTASLLVHHGIVPRPAPGVPLIFEQPAGDVPVLVTATEGGLVRAELAAPGAYDVGGAADAALVAEAAALPADAIRSVPTSASVGLHFLLAALPDEAALMRAHPVQSPLEALARAGHPNLFLYVPPGADGRLRVRQFCATDPQMEDPACGSGNAALAAWLAAHDPRPDGTFRFQAVQGIEMGRPSALWLTVEKVGGAVRGVRLGGEVVPVMAGELTLDAHA